MTKIVAITAYEILDSRGNPTVEVNVTLEGGASGRACVPSGASTGSFEALEKRDNDPSRYNGKGILSLVKSIEGEIFLALKGKLACNQNAVDSVLINLDGTTNKSRLGANALLGVSLATAKAAANFYQMPLYSYLNQKVLKSSYPLKLPMLMLNILNGGVHADNKLDFQEFMIVPSQERGFLAALQIGAEVFQQLKQSLKLNGYNTNVGDEGGFAPALETTTAALEMLSLAVEGAGYRPGVDVNFALDVAANEFYRDGLYHPEGRGLHANEMIAFYQSLVKQYPIISIEDGLAEEDWPAWQLLTHSIGSNVQLVGDDLFVTNINRLKKGILQQSANAILIKPNQIGTLTETLETIHQAKGAGFKVIISHRSGETEDTTIADLAVAVGADYIKSGSLCRSERVAKYNQLIRINRELNSIF